ncbi:hypothetical protein CFC21_065705 [Triticum aestivum]|uniref:Uncharacterized protein n=2 Tax=Triticum aestivum TaxID=4565 RepID=A0A9R1FFV9_WHEAT|nr:hypothetical protein CFC21_039672 [Triticum aestivum]KAF7058703.1 hypothetical protein CFC21_065705 [Triticum aestivum]
MFVQKMPTSAGCGSKRKAEEDGDEVTVKAMAVEEEEAPVTLKAKAMEDEEAAFTTVKAMAEEEAPVTFKAKEAVQVKLVLTKPTWVDVEYSDCDSDEEVDSDDDDAETFLARIRSEYNAHAEKFKADNPWLKWRDYSADPRQQEEAGAVVDGLGSV